MIINYIYLFKLDMSDLTNTTNKHIYYLTKQSDLSITLDGGAKKSKPKKMKSKKHLNNTNYNNSNNSNNFIITNMSDNAENINQPITYIEHLSEPWFSFVSMGLKTVEGRKNKGKFKEMKIGDIIQWTNSDFMERSVKTRIASKAVYSTFSEYLQTEGLNKCLPGMPSLEHGLSVYFKYFTKEEEAEFGVVAIRLELI